MKIRLLFLLCLIFFRIQSGNGCTVFCLSDSSRIIVGKSNAWGMKAGFILVNKRNIVKKAFIMDVDHPVNWISKYGSITFNQISQEMPNGGINEKGLVVEILSSEAAYSEKDKRKAINESQWIQYQLDNFETVEEVIKSEEVLRICRAASDMHYFIVDRFGNRASIDLVEGRFEVHVNEQMPVPVLTNQPYGELLDFSRSQYDLMELSDGSKRRFILANDMIGSNYVPSAGLAWDIINACRQTSNNYNLVYDLHKMTLSFNDPLNPGVKTINIGEIDFTCGVSGAIPINIRKAGDVSNSFIVYSAEENQEQLEKVFQQLVREGRISGVKRLLTRLFYINKLDKIVRDQKCTGSFE